MPCTHRKAATGKGTGVRQTAATIPLDSRDELMRNIKVVSMYGDTGMGVSGLQAVEAAMDGQQARRETAFQQRERRAERLEKQAERQERMLDTAARVVQQVRGVVGLVQESFESCPVHSTYLCVPPLPGAGGTRRCCA